MSFCLIGGVHCNLVVGEGSFFLSCSSNERSIEAGDFSRFEGIIWWLSFCIIDLEYPSQSCNSDRTDSSLGGTVFCKMPLTLVFIATISCSSLFNGFGEVPFKAGDGLKCEDSLRSILFLRFVAESAHKD